MQRHINSASGGRGVAGVEIEERIKRRSWVRIQKRFPQSRLADSAHGQVLPLVPGITKTHLPVPSLEIVAKLSHFAAQAYVEELVPVGELIMSRTGVVNATK